MSKLISGYWWAWREVESGKKSMQTLRKFYPDADLFINVDYEGDVEGYTKVGQELGATVTRNNFQLGYCGNFGDRDIGYDYWTKEKALEWLRGVYSACKKTDSKYIMLFEEDDFVLKNISLLDTDFSMAIHPTSPSPTGKMRANHIPWQFLDFSKKIGGVDSCPGYASGGGTIFNREHFIDSYDRILTKFTDVYDEFCKINKIFGWEDFMFQYIMMLGGYEIIQNEQLCELWEVPEFYGYEILTGCKDPNLVIL
jgi:hypothetical protein|tara:strand:- start:3034 stop:3795 length:762 start_codon:yes stop_codon:yes gene_type:complete